MNTLLVLPASITLSRRLFLITTESPEREKLTELIAALILRGPLFIVAARDWLPAFELTRKVRRQTRQVRETLNRLRTARSSTCYRLLDILASLPPNGEPVLVLDFLHTLYDPDIPLPVRFRVLRECCKHLERLALYRPVIVLTQELPIEEYPKFYSIVRAIADETLRIASDLEPASQPALF
jgi:hypothetical protein